MGWYVALVVLVGLERLAELAVTKRNAAWSFANGGYERGQRHYPFMVALHTGLLAGCLIEVAVADRPFVPALGWSMLAVVLAAAGAAVVVHHDARPAVEHPRDRRAWRAAGRRRPVPVHRRTRTTSRSCSRASRCRWSTRRG